MPYQRNADLPRAQVKDYSAHQRTAFRKAFNHALGEYHGNESVAFAVAHHAAQQTPAVKPKTKPR